MTDPIDTTAKDWRDTVFLPKTDFPMKAGLPAKEPGILARWQKIGLYERLREQRRGREKFILHDGPPYANGDMHIGHAMQRILKDTVVRTQTLLGKDAPFVPGWDCHGLPIEWKVEEEYRKKKRNKDEVPVEEFRAECRAYAQNWVNIQREQIKRLGVIGDWDNPYLTMDFAAEATIVAELMKFAESGQLYRGAKPVMWSPVEKTALAEAEVEYEDITSTQIDVAFEIVESPNCPAIQALIDNGERVHAVIWTTTPWTIPVNQALAYGPEVEYSVVKLKASLGSIQNEFDTFVVAKALLHQFQARLFRHHIERNGQGEWSLSVVETTQAPNWTDLPIATPSTDHMVGGRVYTYEHHVSEGACRFEIQGSDLAGTIARHPMAGRLSSPLPFRGGAGGGDSPQTPTSESVESPHPNPSPEGEGLYLADFFDRPRPFLPGTFVTTETGTGLVHMSPDHGEDDFDLCKANGIDPVFAVEGDGKYRADWAWLGGQGSVINPKFNAPDGPICTALRESGGLLAASADYKHSYPHSWRSKAKVIYRCTPQWFVPMDKALKPLPFRGGVGVGPVDVALASLGEQTLAPTPSPSPEGEGLMTLRSTAMTAIAATRWVPEKGRNRINSMVEGRPDWVLSRQRAWGVPITLFVDRKSGQYLCDPQVNARIIAAVREAGVDAWNDEAAQGFLGDAYKLDDYERVTDILDVWFDSGCTHAFVLESGKWPDLVRDGPADLYLEGSDQHRGWFQSSLLESCGTRGRAPYKAVLTHGFTMDAKGMKMSKSLGNTINPVDLMKESGADILRLWALTVDFTEDHRIGKEILSGVSDQYRKLRNTFRYMLGALEGFSDAEKVAVADMPELERYVLHLLADMDTKLKTAVNDFDFNTYVRLITDFANNDLSAFFFDIRKDSLYCEVNPATGFQTHKRKAYRTVLDILFHALVRYAAPVLVFTAEEIWQTRYPDSAESVHFLEWPVLAKLDHADAFDNPKFVLQANAMGWNAIRRTRDAILKEIEPMRREKTLGSSLEARVKFPFGSLGVSAEDWAEICIVSEVENSSDATVTKTTHHKCGRCWRHLPEVSEDGALCGRCEAVVNG